MMDSFYIARPTKIFLMKGVSPMIAVVLLIAITVLLSGVIFGWIKLFSFTETEKISNRTEGLTSCSGSAINIDDVYLDFGANKSRATVRNTGQLTERIISAQLLNTNGINATALGNQTVTIARGEVKIIEFSLNGTISNCANFSQVKVSTICSNGVYKKTPTNCG